MRIASPGSACRRMKDAVKAAQRTMRACPIRLARYLDIEDPM
jgi:hypothetical protein